MALVTMDSTNFVVGTNGVSTVSFGAGYRHLAVTSLDGGGTVGFRFNTTTSMTSTNAFGGDNWYVPAAVGAGWDLLIVPDDGNVFDTTAAAFFVELCASNSTCRVAVTAWA